jgi:L-alanine-DL-glutamate epimerase-like enolase superfamily enzyme
MAMEAPGRPGVRPHETGARIEHVLVSAFAMPTDLPEADGTLEWNRTVLVAVELGGGGEHGFGYTYADEATAKLVESELAEVVLGADAFAIPALRAALRRKVRNLGARGVAAMALSAVDTALWDFKARVLGVSLLALLGKRRAAVAAYGSGGFTSYSLEQLERQLAGFVLQGLRSVKMKVGSEPLRDPERVSAARAAIGDQVELFVDANGAYSRKLSLSLAEHFADQATRASSGSRSPFRRTISLGCASSATARRPAWRLRPANTATKAATSAACSKPARWTSSKPTRPVAAA